MSLKRINLVIQIYLQSPIIIEHRRHFKVFSEVHEQGTLQEMPPYMMNKYIYRAAKQKKETNNVKK